MNSICRLITTALTAQAYSRALVLLLLVSCWRVRERQTKIRRVYYIVGHNKGAESRNIADLYNEYGLSSGDNFQRFPHIYSVRIYMRRNFNAKIDMRDKTMS